MDKDRSINRLVLLVFAPLLILAGVLGFVLPESKSLTSGAPSYDVFHIAFGIAGLLIVLRGNEGAIRAFNVGFGLIDLYQAAASFAHLFPETYFRWTRADDALHVVIGTLLVGVGVFGGRKGAG